MERGIYVNLPVKSLEHSAAFFKKLGFEFDQQFSDDKGTMMIVNKGASVMFLTEEFFQSFSKKPVGDAWKSPEVIMALGAVSKADVDQQAVNVKEAGGKIVDRFTEPESMYGIRFEDLDGHLWEIFYMDMTAMK